MTKLSYSFFPNTAKKSAKSTKTPVYVRVILKGKKAESRLNLELDDREVKYWLPDMMRVGLPKCIANDHLDSINTEFKKFLALNDHQLNKLTVSQVRDIVLNKEEPIQNQTNIIAYIDKYYQNSVLNRPSFKIGTKKNYVKAITHIKKFAKIEALEKVTFNEFDFNYAVKLKNYLLNDKPEIKKKGMTEVSAYGIIKKYRTIFDQAIEEKLIEKNYFKSIKLKNESPRKPSLTIDRLKALFDLKVGLSYRDELSRDLIFFSSITGLAYADTLFLPKSCLEYKESGEVKLDTSRIKTKVFVQQFLTSFAINMINKYKDHPLSSSTPYVFPFIDNSDYNKILKLLALKTSVNFKLSTHTGRHSFRQFLPEAGIEDSSVISRMMGKAIKDRVDNVYYEITESRLIEAKRKFELYLCNNLNEPQEEK